jgi:hemolysin III
VTAPGRAAAVPPRLRGVLHAGALPLCAAAGVALVALAPDGSARMAAAVYAASACALFAVSALYHLGRGSEARHRLMARLDHAGIYLIIAGTYTPFAALALTGAARAAILACVWGGAVAGVALHLIWARPPVWLTMPLYLGLGWIAALAIPELLAGAGVAAVVLAIVGGGLYTAGGLVYATKRPDPAPSVFGYHEVFHALTVAAFVVQYVAVSLVVY